MPGTKEATIARIEERLKQIPPVSRMIENGLSPEQMLEQILGDGDVRVLETMPVTFVCRCSRERIADALVSLGPEEIQDIIDNEGQAEASCHFCNETYHFAKEELEQLKQLAEKR
jgi:molecular chaperone Hsp33